MPEYEVTVSYLMTVFTAAENEAQAYAIGKMRGAASYREYAQITVREIESVPTDVRAGEPG